MLTKTQIEILKIFTSRITEEFSINEISKILGKPYALVYRSMKPLIGKYLKKEKKGSTLDYKSHHATLAYIESLRTEAFFKRNDELEFFRQAVLEIMKDSFFVLVVFGSTVTEKKPNDTDILVLIDKSDTESIDKAIFNIAERTLRKPDVTVLSIESASELFSKWDDKNILNETLNKHLILHGAENYYKMLKDGRR